MNNIGKITVLLVLLLSAQRIFGDTDEVIEAAMDYNIWNAINRCDTLKTYGINIKNKKQVQYGIPIKVLGASYDYILEYDGTKDFLEGFILKEYWVPIIWNDISLGAVIVRKKNIEGKTNYMALAYAESCEDNITDAMVMLQDMYSALDSIDIYLIDIYPVAWPKALLRIGCEYKIIDGDIRDGAHCIEWFDTSNLSDVLPTWKKRAADVKKQIERSEKTSFF